MSRKALLASIEHWKRLEACETIDAVDEEGTCAEHCALCGLYFHKDCAGCPVFKHTGQTCCEGTPYYDADMALYSDDMDSFREHATEMRRFLEELL